MRKLAAPLVAEFLLLIVAVRVKPLRISLIRNYPNGTITANRRG